MEEDKRKSELNILNLPQKYHNLYSEETFEYLVSGCIKSDNWSTIKRNGFDSELHDIFDAMPCGESVYVYVTTAMDDTWCKNFGLALVNGRRMKEEEIGKAVSYIRRMYTGIYDDMKDLLADSDEEYLEKLQANSKAQSSPIILNEMRRIKDYIMAIQ